MNLNVDPKTTIEVFVRNIGELSKEKYVKHINDPKDYSLQLQNQQLTETQGNLPDEVILSSFVSKFRDFFSNSSPYCVRNVRPILDVYLPNEKDIFEAYCINEQSWKDFRIKYKPNMTLDKRVGGITTNKKKYREIYTVYNEYLYAFYLHKDEDKRERLELPFAETISKPLFYLFIDYGF
jgi:hypothetical protein